MPAEAFYIYLIFAIAAVIGGLAIFIAHRVQKSARLVRALELVLYEITQPLEAPKDSGIKLKDMIASMEQFYAGMSSIREAGLKSFFAGRPYFSLELALPSIGEETTFFAAVPRKYQRLFEKQVESFFPHASIVIKEDDYNIFNPKGVSSAAYLKLMANPALPIKTYQSLETDPLEVLANAFSKLKAEGEGAAVQIVLTPESGSFAKSIDIISKNFSKTGELIGPGGKGPLKVFLDVMGEIFGARKQKEEREKTRSPFDEEIIKLLESKKSKVIFKTNVRILASAAIQADADNIVKEIGSAFSQFKEPNGNGFVMAPQKGHGFDNAVYKFIMRFFDDSQALYLNTAELTSIFHFPVGLIAAPKIKYLRAKEASPPANLPKTGILLGKSSYRGEEQDIRLAKDDRRRHLYIVGQTGTGKSVLLQSVAIQDIVAGEGICFIDPHGDAVEEILSHIPKERTDDVIVFDPGNVARPMGLNMLEYDAAHPEQKTFIINELLEIFNKLYNMSVAGGPMFEQYFRNAAMLVMDDPESGNTILEIARVLSEKPFRDYKLSRSKNPVVISFWRDVAEKAGGEASLQNMVPYITSKFDTFLTNEIMRPILIQEHSSINFRKIMDEGKILLVNLSKGKLGDLNAHLLGLIIVGRISMAALSRIDITDERQRRDFYLYIDEFQNVTTKSISTILSEARKYKLNLVMAHQFISQLEEEIKKAVFGNVGSLASFRIGADDSEFLEKQFTPVFSAQDLMNVENYRAFVKLLVEGHISRPFNIKTVPFEKGDPKIASAIKDLSAVKYGRPREDVEAEIAAKYRV